MDPLIMKLATYLILALAMTLSVQSQDIVSSAEKFINLLDTKQKGLTLFPFDTDERYGFHYFPIDDRKGIPWDQLSDDQKTAALDLMRTCLSDSAVKKVKQIMELEILLKALEQRSSDDHFRDPGKYYFTIFGLPGAKTIWGWRLEGHHVSFNFSVQERKLVAGTPAFLGANPAVVQEGPQKGKEILKEERTMGFDLLHSLSKAQLQKVIFSSSPPHDIVTSISRKAAIDHPAGLKFTELSQEQQQLMLRLISLYVHRFTKLFADNMLKEIQDAGLNNLWFAWSGHTEPGIGNPHYYRIQGPTIIIEYDNTQNDGNHLHTVVRDLNHDFGGDLLLQHYQSDHKN
ncbi:MAG: hypothetical protein C5B59_05450 [Bacteroidetes bacterium]|nr:MAG: hypothetical protein C5B59_05450 [Bacteroidota bacterium]